MLIKFEHIMKVPEDNVLRNLQNCSRYKNGELDGFIFTVCSRTDEPELYSKVRSDVYVFAENNQCQVIPFTNNREWGRWRFHKSILEAGSNTIVFVDVNSYMDYYANRILAKDITDHFSSSSAKVNFIFYATRLEPDIWEMSDYVHTE